VTNVSSSLSILALFKKVCIEENSRSGEHGLLIRGRTRGKLHVKGVGFRQDFRHETLGKLDNLSCVLRTTIRASLLRRGKHVKGNLATDRETILALGTTIVTNTATTSGRMDNVNFVTRVIEHCELWYTVVTIFLDRTEFAASAGETHGLVTATLAISNRTGKRTVHRENLCRRRRVLDHHFEWMTGTAKETDATIGILEGIRELIAFDEVLEF